MSVQEDEAITARGAGSRHMVRVEVVLRDGTHLEETVEAPRGSETHFASDADVIDKFRKLATHQLVVPEVDRIVDLVMGLERHAGGRACWRQAAGQLSIPGHPKGLT